MDRKKYLQLCQKNAVNPKTIKVLVDGVEYYPIGYDLKFNSKGEPLHHTILQDTKAGSIVIARLCDIKEKGDE